MSDPRLVNEARQWLEEWVSTGEPRKDKLASLAALLERLCGEARKQEPGNLMELVDVLRHDLAEAQRREALAEERRGEALVLLDRLIVSAENTGSGTRPPVKAARAYLVKEVEREKAMLRALVSPAVPEAKP